MYERLFLTDAAIAQLPNAAPGSSYKAQDEGVKGLHLTVAHSGRKDWRLRFTMDGESITMTLGQYPANSIEAARAWARDQHAQRKAGVDPRASLIVKPARKQPHTFEQTAREWHALTAKIWSSKYCVDTMRSFEKDIFPAKIEGTKLTFGQLRLTDVMPMQVLEVVRRVEARGSLDVAADVLRLIGQVYKWAIPLGRATDNPAANISGALQKRVRTHHAALAYKDLAEFFRKMRAYQSKAPAKIGLELVAMLAPRTDELREARWSEVDWAQKVIRIPASRMKDQQSRRKARGEFQIPLAPQALALLEKLKALTGHGDLLFPGRELGAPISGATWLQALKRMGYKNKATVHGFRSTFSTTAHEAGFDSLVIERQLDHVQQNKVSAAYNRSEYMDARRELMTWWADQIERAKAGATDCVNKRDHERAAAPAPAAAPMRPAMREACAADFA